MTQKELLYIEDAVEHEKIISNMICQSIDLIEDKDLESFLKKELKKHKSMENKLMDFLKECSK